MYFIQDCFICRPTDSIVSEDAVAKLGIVAIFWCVCVWGGGDDIPLAGDYS
jgi:hypothetical protein